MTATLSRSTDTSARHRYQRHIAGLLETIDERRHQLLLSRANGAQAAALRDLKAELETVRHELAATTAASSH